MTADEVLLKKKKDPKPELPPLRKSDLEAGLVKEPPKSPLTRIYRWATSGKVRPYANIVDLNEPRRDTSLFPDTEDAPKHRAVEVGIKISF